MRTGRVNRSRRGRPEQVDGVASRPVAYLPNPYQRPADPRTSWGGCPAGRPRLDGEAARPLGQRSTPVNCGSRSDACPIRCIDGEGGARSRPPWPSPSAVSPSRRLLWLTGSSTRPSTAPATTSAPSAEGTVFNNADTRIPMIVAGQRQHRDRRLARRLHDARALQRRRRARHHVRQRRLRDARSSRARRRAGPGNSGATAMTHGRRRQHHRRRLRRLAVEFVARFTRRRRLHRAAPSATRRT